MFEGGLEDEPVAEFDVSQLVVISERIFLRKNIVYVRIGLLIRCRKSIFGVQVVPYR